MLRAGSVTRNYYRPRISTRTGEIVVAEQLGDRWRVARVSPETGELRYADPDDGVNRYDATYDADGVSIITTSERSGFMNLERLAPDSSAPVSITRLAGAAVAADVAPDSAVWFLDLKSYGFDLRRLGRDTAAIASALPSVVIGDTLSSVLPPRRASSTDTLGARPRAATPTEQPYGLGPSRIRYVPSASSGYGGTTTSLAIVRSDPVGRLGASIMGSVGAASLPAGAVLALTSRVNRTVVGLSAWTSHEAPSRQFADARELGLDLSRFGGALRLDRRLVRASGEMNTTLALLAERQRAAEMSDANRTAAVGSFVGTLRNSDEDVRYLLQLSALGEVGSTAGGRYGRHRSELLFGTARGYRPLVTARFAYGTIGSGNGSTRERFVVGGFRSPLVDPLFDARRVDEPAYPLGSASGSTFASYRLGMPLEALELFYSGVTVDFFQQQLRSYGVELRQRVPAVAALGTPEVDVVTGIARARDFPVQRNWRYYVSFSLKP